jgi:predicted RNA methylase
MDQYLAPESDVPNRLLPPDATVSQLAGPGLASELPEPHGSNAGSRIVDLLAGTAKMGIGAATLVAGEITSRSVGIARVVVPASIAEGPLDAVERHLGRRQDTARKSEIE